MFLLKEAKHFSSNQGKVKHKYQEIMICEKNEAHVDCAIGKKTKDFDKQYDPLKVGLTHQIGVS